jgi:hypothetical protein
MAKPSDIQVFDLERALGRLNDLASRSTGWKGPDSVAMPASVRVSTEAFLRAYDGIGSVKDLFVGLDADGDVTLFMKDKALILDLSIGQDCTYSFYAETTDGQTFQGERRMATDPLPDGLIAQLVIPKSATGVAEQFQKSAD